MENEIYCKTIDTKHLDESKLEQETNISLFKKHIVILPPMNTPRRDYVEDQPLFD